MFIRDRIMDFRRVPAGTLVSNPRNWRTHPPAQRDALRGVLEEVGYAGALLVRELPEGSLMLIDGHLRAELTPDQDVPVLVLDVTESEADTLLATFDPISALAGADRLVLDQVLGRVRSENAAVQALLASLTKCTGSEDSESFKDETPPPAGITQKFSIIIDCQDEAQQVELLERFTQEGLSCRAFAV